MVAGVRIDRGDRQPSAVSVLYGLVAFAMTVLARPGAIATLAAALLLEAALVARTGLSRRLALRRRHAACRSGPRGCVLLLHGLAALSPRAPRDR
jgi:hypothetical protein